jgi:hypothetical protein
MIWERRSTNPSEELKPAFNGPRFASVNECTNNNVFMPNMTQLQIFASSESLRNFSHSDGDFLRFHDKRM